MKKKILTLMMGTLLLLTACGQTRDSSASTMLPVAAVQSAAQAIAPVEDKAQENTESLPAEETIEETKGAGDEETSKPADSEETPSGKAEEDGHDHAVKFNNNGTAFRKGTAIPLLRPFR